MIRIRIKRISQIAQLMLSLAWLLQPRLLYDWRCSCCCCCCASGHAIESIYSIPYMCTRSIVLSFSAINPKNATPIRSNNTTWFQRFLFAFRTSSHTHTQHIHTCEHRLLAQLFAFISHCADNSRKELAKRCAPYSIWVGWMCERDTKITRTRSDSTKYVISEILHICGKGACVCVSMCVSQTLNCGQSSWLRVRDITY